MRRRPNDHHTGFVQPIRLCNRVDPEVAVFSVSGRYDEFGYVDGGIARLPTLALRAVGV
jgi:hypothetical protein